MIRCWLSFIAVLIISLPGNADSQVPTNDTVPPKSMSYIIKAPLLEQPASNLVRASGGVTVTSEGIVLKGSEIIGNLATSEWEAGGDVSIIWENSTLRASSLKYNTLARTGTLNKATGQYGVFFFSGNSAEIKSDGLLVVHEATTTTCDKPHPHWAIHAKAVEIRQGQYAKVRKLGFSIGGATVFMFPRYTFDLGARNTTFLPSPGYDQRDGASLGIFYPLSIPWATGAAINTRLTQRSGIPASIEFQRDLHFTGSDRNFQELPSEIPADLTSLSLLTTQKNTRRARLRTTQGSEQPLQGSALASVLIGPRTSRTFIKVASKERIMDPIARYVTLDRQPEIGLRFLGIPADVPLLPNYLLGIDAQADWGKLRERENPLWRSRWDARVIARIRKKSDSPWTFEPAVLARYSRYSKGENQRVLAASIALGRQLTPQYFATVTYIRHWLRGASPMQFDNVDVLTEIGAGIEGTWGSTRARLTLQFDLHRGGLYDWGLDLSRAFHCFEPRISYQNRYRSFNASLAVIAIRM